MLVFEKRTVTNELANIKRRFHAYPLGSSVQLSFTRHASKKCASQADGLHCRNNLRLCCSGFARMQRLLPVSSRSLHDLATAEGFELNLNLSRILEASIFGRIDTFRAGFFDCIKEGINYGHGIIHSDHVVELVVLVRGITEHVIRESYCE